MLTKMPKVGDVLIANENVDFGGGSVTCGAEYEVLPAIYVGGVVLKNNSGFYSVISPERYKHFTLKARHVGFIEVNGWETTEIRSTELCEKSHVVTLTVDDAGLTSVRNLARQSGTEKLRNSIQTKIDALQKELDAI